MNDGAAALEPQVTIDTQKVIEALRQDVLGVLSGFATQEDLSSAVNKVADAAVAAAKGAFDDLRIAQVAFQDEQRKTQEAFIVEMRNKFTDYAPVKTVDSLRSKVEDSHRHFESVTGGHAEAITELKAWRAKFETKANQDVAAIRASVDNIDTRTGVITSSVQQLIETQKQYQAAADTRMTAVESTQKTQAKRLDDAGELIRTVDMESRDIEGRVRVGMTRIEKAMFGDAEAKEPGIVSEVKTLKKDLSLLAWLSGTKAGNAVVVGAWSASVYLLQHPEWLQQIRVFFFGK